MSHLLLHNSFSIPLKPMKKLIPFFLFAFLCSCREHIDSEETWTQKAENANSVKSNDIASKYNASTNWDSVGDFSYVLNQQVGKSIGYIGNIDDIVLLDSGFVLKVSKRGQRSSAIISINKSQLETVGNFLKLKKRHPMGCFVTQVLAIDSNRVIHGKLLDSYLYYRPSYLDYEEYRDKFNE